MPEKDSNPFLPDFSGPLTGALEQGSRPQQDQGLQVPNPNARVSKFAAAAAITDQFLKGIEKGRVRRFAVAQEAKQQKVNAVLGNLARIKADPNITDEAKSQVEKAAYTSIFAYAQQQMGDADGGGKGKGKGKGKNGEQHEGPMGHVLGFGKHLLEGMTGGPLPKGTPDIDLGGTLAAMNVVYGSNGQIKPQYSVEAQRNALNNKIQAEATKEGAFSETSARSAINKFYPEIQKVYGNESQRFIENYARGYSSYTGPEEGAVGRERARNGQGGAQQQGQQPNPQAPPGAPPPGQQPQAGAKQQPKLNASMGPAGELIPGTKPQAGPPGPQAPPGAQQQGQPQQGGYTHTGMDLSQRLKDEQILYPGTVHIGTKPEDITYTGADGKEHHEQAVPVVSAFASGFRSVNTGEMLPPTAASTAETLGYEKKMGDIQKALDQQTNKERELTLREKTLEEKIRNDKDLSGDRKKKEADLEVSRKKNEADRMQIHRDTQALQQDRIRMTGVMQGVHLTTNLTRQASLIQQRSTANAIKISGNAAIRPEIQTAMIQKDQEATRKQLDELDSQMKTGLAAISKQTGAQFDANGAPVETEPQPKKEAGKKGKEKAGAAPAAGRGQKLLDSLIAK